VQNLERISAWDARKNGDPVGNRDLWRTGDGDADGFRRLSATPARDARGRARTIVLTLTGEFEIGTWLAGDER
jgi:hypothetical protein